MMVRRYRCGNVEPGQQLSAMPCIFCGDEVNFAQRPVQRVMTGRQDSRSVLPPRIVFQSFSITDLQSYNCNMGTISIFQHIVMAILQVNFRKLISKYSSHFSLTCISVILFTFVAGCGAPVSEPSKDTPTIALEPEPSPTPQPDTVVIPPVEDFSPDDELLPEPATPAKAVWETLIDAQDEPANYNRRLLEAINQLLDESRVSEAVSIFQLIAFEPLQLQDLVAYELTEARIDQALSRHNSALGKLARIGQRPGLTPKQKTELIRLRINSLVACLETELALLPNSFHCIQLLTQTRRKP